ncbi:4a-hydroxytetrahydrobiopterin dehydratase [Paenibacillus macquariensis]|uniref:4a-hydroxytetrahydrobiopterin dehydratase n=1 Tax=Paenibacillus macquariensis TaxID=948756 RepID=A0ABY1KFJ2_9BACL|nr:4a-hydroxytetrahydrobiopterin dehydratase [Paenibacillus macquariensis]MEC0093394.1 4a-hydroxytetrahydrobiopterin dehydratase [Paenibacillus macquariensis]OAB29289.1 pterin-4-alpha-carbinolamine dehydratase [Paenibacillus macquariensis subsp. macquariensis]SIR63621.1 pterin-4-alpha-carbinolamine dehydratase [Paenibacillus macquariensis]
MSYTKEQVDAHLNLLKGWTLVEERFIERKYVFYSFMKGISFVDEVATISEAFNHHPLITINYKTVTLRLTSWDAGYLTAIDMKEAQQYNEAFEKMCSSERKNVRQRS